jgi:hypothetical protein
VGLPPSPHRRPGRVRPPDRRTGARQRLRTHRHHRLLGPHPAPPLCEWAQAGHGRALLRICLAAYDRIIGLDLDDLAVDGCITKAPCGGEVAGRSPVDRGKQGMKRSVASDGQGLPLRLVTARANDHDSPLLEPTLAGVVDMIGTVPVKPLFTQTIRAFGFGARQRSSGRVVISAGLNARVFHRVSLADFNGLRYWLPRAISEEHLTGLRRPCSPQPDPTPLDLDIDLVPHNSAEPRVDRPLVNASLAKLGTVVPDLRGARVGRYWGGLIDLTPDGLPVIDGGSGPRGLSIITGLAGRGFTLGPHLRKSPRTCRWAWPQADPSSRFGCRASAR